MLLLLAFCRKENLIVIEVPSELAYASLVIDGAYGTADTSSAPTVNWNNQEGTYELVAPYPNGFALNSSTGKVSWSPNVQDSTYAIKVRAKNNAGNSQPVTLTVNIKPQKPSNLNYAVNQIQILSLPTATGDTTSVAASVSWGSKKAGYYQIDSGAFVGLKINKQNGVLSIPKNTKKATYRIKIRAYNTVGESEAVDYKLIVAPTFYQVTFDVNGGSTTQSKEYVQTIADGLNATAPNTSPQKVGFTFAGWFIASNGGTAVTTFGPIAQATTYYAQYTLAAPSALKYNPDSATNDFGIAGQSAIPTVITGVTGKDSIRYTMTILPTINGISIDTMTGVISWTNTVPVGKHEITIIPRNRDDINSNGTPVKYTLNITKFAPKDLLYKNTDGTSAASATSDFGKSGSSVVPKIDSGGVSVSYAMTTSPVTSGISIDAITGKILWADTVIVRAYNLQITPSNIKGAGTSVGYALTIKEVAPKDLAYSKDSSIRNFGIADSSVAPTINNGGATVTYTISGNPSGVTINSTTGKILWTNAVVTGIYPLTITATNSAGSTTKSYTLTIKAIVPSAFSYSKDTAIRNFGTSDTSVTPTIKNGGAPVSYSITSSPVPAGVSVNDKTGKILWTNEVPVGIYSFRVIARNQADTIGANYGLTIKAVKPSGLAYSKDTSIRNFGTADASVTPSINNGGAATVTYSMSGNPSGVSVNQNTGQISWTNTVLAGTYPLKITPTNSAGAGNPVFYILTINAVAPSGLVYSKDSSIRNFGTSDTSVTPTINKGGAFVTYAISSFTKDGDTSTSGSPSGVSINSTTGQISWTDGVAVGTYKLTITPTNSVGAGTPAVYTLTITSP